MISADVSAAWIIYLAQSDEFQGQTYYMIDQFLIDIIPTDISAHFGENIDGDNRIGKPKNGLFRKNYLKFHAELIIMLNFLNSRFGIQLILQRKRT